MQKLKALTAIRDVIQLGKNSELQKTISNQLNTIAQTEYNEADKGNARLSEMINKGMKGTVRNFINKKFIPNSGYSNVY